MRDETKTNQKQVPECDITTQNQKSTEACNICQVIDKARHHIYWIERQRYIFGCHEDLLEEFEDIVAKLGTLEVKVTKIACE